MQNRRQPPMPPSAPPSKISRKRSKARPLPHAPQLNGGARQGEGVTGRRARSHPPPEPPHPLSQVAQPSLTTQVSLELSAAGASVRWMPDCLAPSTMELGSSQRMDVTGVEYRMCFQFRSRAAGQQGSRAGHQGSRMLIVDNG